MQDQNGNRHANQVLRAIDEDLYRKWEPDFRVSEVKRGNVLVQAGDRSAQIYFPLEGAVVSLLVLSSSGEAVESGLTGSEGYVGLAAVLGNSVSPQQAIVQASGSVIRIRAELVLRELETRPRFRRMLLAYANYVLGQATQLSLCNRLHQVDERMARWLLLFEDRSGSPTLTLTHELMSQMLGARRATVSLSASTLQQAGLISYVHGKVRLLDRKGLELAACDCYGANVKHLQDYLSTLER